MTRESYSFRRFRVQADTEPDAEPVRVAMQCAVCRTFGPLVEASKEATDEARAKSAEEARRFAAGEIQREALESGRHISANAGMPDHIFGTGDIHVSYSLPVARLPTTTPAASR